MDDDVDVTQDLKKAASASEPERTKLFSATVDSLRYQENKDRALIFKRFVGREINIQGLTRLDLLNFHARFVDDFWPLLGSEAFELHVQAKISELWDYCDRIAVASKETVEYWHMADAENENRYARYLESALLEFDFLNPNTQSLPRKFSYAQVALIYFFQEKQITRANGAAIAALYGFNAKTSRDQLYGAYNELCDSKKNPPTTVKGIHNRIKSIKSVIPDLPTPEARQAAQNALEKLGLLLRTF
jgi:hypothetical protein